LKNATEIPQLPDRISHLLKTESLW